MGSLMSSEGQGKGSYKDDVKMACLQRRGTDDLEMAECVENNEFQLWKWHNKRSDRDSPQHGMLKYKHDLNKCLTMNGGHQDVKMLKLKPCRDYSAEQQWEWAVDPTEDATQYKEPPLIDGKGTPVKASGWIELTGTIPGRIYPQGLKIEKCENCGGTLADERLILTSCSADPHTKVAAPSQKWQFSPSTDSKDASGKKLSGKKDIKKENSRKV